MAFILEYVYTDCFDSLIKTKTKTFDSIEKVCKSIKLTITNTRNNIIFSEHESVLSNDSEMLSIVSYSKELKQKNNPDAGYNVEIYITNVNKIDLSKYSIDENFNLTILIQ